MYYSNYSCLPRPLSYSFIHTFIMEIYIAPLQGYCSEAFPTLAQLKRIVFMLEQNMLEKTLGSNRCANEAHSIQRGQPPVNARTWLVEVRAIGTKRNPRSIERRELQSLVPGVGQQRSRR